MKMKKTTDYKKAGVKSPCIKKCSLDKNKICPSCYRSIDEIVSWPGADETMRLNILEAARARRARIKK